jgi:GntR family transcriptional repressor for pyruvate dehydrogenase complex
VLFEPLTRVLAARRRETSKVLEIQANAILQHAHVISALETGDAEAARVAMNEHMDQTLSDLKRYVFAAADDEHGPHHLGSAADSAP